MQDVFRADVRESSAIDGALGVRLCACVSAKMSYGQRPLGNLLALREALGSGGDLHGRLELVAHILHGVHDLVRLRRLEQVGGVARARWVRANNTPHGSAGK